MSEFFGLTDYERANLTNRVILALPADYEPLPGPMCREVAADMAAHAIGRGGCDVADLDDYMRSVMYKNYPDAEFVTLEHNSAKEWGLLD